MSSEPPPLPNTTNSPSPQKSDEEDQSPQKATEIPAPDATESPPPIKKKRSRFDQAPPDLESIKSAKIENFENDNTKTNSSSEMEKVIIHAQKSAEITGSSASGFEAKVAIPEELTSDRSINFIGLVIGPGGITQKSLSRDLQCRINILGPNGEKVTRESTRGLYFSLTAASKSVLDVAVAYINQLITDPEQRVSLQINQTNSAVIQKSGGYNGMTPYDPNVVMIPSDKVGIVIGKGGETVKDAMKRTGAIIRIETEHNPMHPTTREVHIQGNYQQIEMAKQIINSLVCDRAYRPDGQLEFEDYFEIPQNLIGIVIGKAGETIKNLQKTTNCGIQVVVQGDPADPYVKKVVKLKGTSFEINNAKQQIMYLTSKYKTTPDSANRPVGSDVEIIAIPASCVGTLLGRGGESVKRLAFLTGTRVQILPPEQQQDDGFDCAQYKKVSIRGDRGCIDHAKTEVQRLIDALASAHQRPDVVNPQAATSPEEERELTRRYLEQQSGQLPEWAVMGPPAAQAAGYGQQAAYYGAQPAGYGYANQAMAAYYGAAAPAAGYAQGAAGGYDGYAAQAQYYGQPQQAYGAGAMGAGGAEWQMPQGNGGAGSNGD